MPTYTRTSSVCSGQIVKGPNAFARPSLWEISHDIRYADRIVLEVLAHLLRSLHDQLPMMNTAISPAIATPKYFAVS